MKFEDTKGVIRISTLRRDWRYQRGNQNQYKTSLKIPKG